VENSETIAANAGITNEVFIVNANLDLEVGKVLIDKQNWLKK
jgi:hypothetical protein